MSVLYQKPREPRLTLVAAYHGKCFSAQEKPSLF
jgi:hypothetical protein